MPTYLDYAALSALVYNDARGQKNKLPTPQVEGWIELPLNSNSSITGFTAAAFQNTQTNEIVIAFKGTDSGNIVQMAQDFVFGNTAAFGGSLQLYQAALFYEQVKAQYGSNISFTGHSLGGGLASVMGVWFGKSATTFAQAPFELAAVNPLAIAKVGTLLAGAGYFDPDFLAVNPLSYSSREANITNYSVPGEVLSKYLFLLPNVVGPNIPIAVGGVSSIDPSTLHSIVLHASLLMSQTFKNDTVLLPKLLTEIFDTNLYASPSLRGEVRDFLNHLLNDQIRVGYTNADGLLSRFAGDIDKLTQYDANLKDGALGKALIDVAIADYYFKQNGFDKEFFKAISGGISFDLTDIGANWSSNKTVRQLDDAIISQYLNGDQASRLFLAQDNYWSIQSGGTALNTTGTGSNNDAMIGGTTGDTLDGGAGNDFLYGGDGNDDLSAFKGGNYLDGGDGKDTLWADGGNNTLFAGAGDDTAAGEAANDSDYQTLLERIAA